MTVPLKPPSTSIRNRILGGVSAATLALAALEVILMLSGSGGSLLAPLILAVIVLGSGSIWLRERRLMKDASTGRPPLAQQTLLPTFLRNANTYERILCLGGAGGILVGAITGFWASGAGREEKNANEILVMLGGFEYYDSAAGESFLGWMWFGIVLAVLGAVLLVTFVAIRAANSNRTA